DYSVVEEDIKSVVNAANNKALVKVIIETCLLTDEEKKTACRLALEAGADYVKTSTGFSTGGAKVEDIKLMKSVVGDKLGIKASGGIKDLKTATELIEAGATRLGTSSGIKILNGK
ncbi:MAG: deoxyribose-phosphate aldolase, partial [Tissierellia bacterium]|nr:deoxyribose-phosphate aldolase [Tissierellia bacterium]